jgi:hypothetical protein
VDTQPRTRSVPTFTSMPQTANWGKLERFEELLEFKNAQ